MAIRSCLCSTAQRLSHVRPMHKRHLALSCLSWSWSSRIWRSISLLKFRSAKNSYNYGSFCSTTWYVAEKAGPKWIDSEKPEWNWLLFIVAVGPNSLVRSTWLILTSRSSKSPFFIYCLFIVYYKSSLWCDFCFFHSHSLEAAHFMLLCFHLFRRTTIKWQHAF